MYNRTTHALTTLPTVGNGNEKDVAATIIRNHYCVATIETNIDERGGTVYHTAIVGTDS
jgi:hypothetical protein